MGTRNMEFYIDPFWCKKIPKGVIRIRKSRDRQHNGQKQKDKQRSTKHTNKTKDRVTRTQLRTGG